MHHEKGRPGSDYKVCLPFTKSLFESYTFGKLNCFIPGANVQRNVHYLGPHLWNVPKEKRLKNVSRKMSIKIKNKLDGRLLELLL